MCLVGCPKDKKGKTHNLANCFYISISISIKILLLNNKKYPVAKVREFGQRSGLRQTLMVTYIPVTCIILQKLLS